MESTTDLLLRIPQLLNIKTPQLIGIIAGCIVFSITIFVVIYLLVASGTLQRAFQEITTGKPVPREVAANPSTVKASDEKSTVSVQMAAIPELYEHLLDAANSLPITPSCQSLEAPSISIVSISKTQCSAVFLAGNGSAIFGESAYDPARLWGWLSDESIAPKSKSSSDPLSFPVESEARFTSTFCPNQDPSTSRNLVHLVVVDKELKKPIGMLSVVDNDPKNLSARIDNVWITPAFQRKKRGHEAVFVVLRWLFSLGYRRITAEVDARHTLGRKFLEQCGFLFECELRKHRIAFRRNRDTAVYVILNHEWNEVEVKLKTLLKIPLKDPSHKIAEIGTPDFVPSDSTKKKK